MLQDVRDLGRRQLWNLPTVTTSHTQAHCTPFTLPSAGVLTLGDNSVVTLTTDVVFQPECTGTRTGDVFSVGHLKDPFYASTIPMVYVISAATVIAWVLVIMLTITPRTSFFGAPGAPAFGNGHGIIGGANGGNLGTTGGGSRPWLQKVAALAVAISLTIATADTLEVAERQYGVGYMDAAALRKEVLGSMEIRVMRVISDIFLWLAQVQTLIRLFPRHREKVMIKWIGFVLIILDTVFSGLNSFLIDTGARNGRMFADAIPALSYLFELALGLLYAAWVLYYSLTKRRYAFYHPKLRSMLLISLLSVISVLTPVVFFITDVSNQDVAGWGDYFRWVGAAAASVIVWEWVERIEALERDDKKDGILGREIFDGDEMLDVVPEEDAAWTQSRNIRRNFRRHGRDDDPGGGGRSSSMAERGLRASGVHQRVQRHQQSPSHFPLGRAHSTSAPNSHEQMRATPPVARPASAILGGPSPPLTVASPISRTDTTSAASTVYVVRYHPIADVPQPIRRRDSRRTQATAAPGRQRQTNREISEKDVIEEEEQPRPNRHRESSIWNTVSNPFKRKRTSPPQEVQRARQVAEQQGETPKDSSRWDMRSRLGTLASETGERFRDMASERNAVPELPVTIVPAQPRGNNRTWTPAKTAPKPAVGDSSLSPSSGGTGSTTLMEGDADVTESRPPRADDISPVAGRNGGTVVIPAPPRRTPSHQTPSPLAAERTDVRRTRRAPTRSSSDNPLTHTGRPPDPSGAGDVR
jgi:hypothetical protein